MLPEPSALLVADSFRVRRNPVSGAAEVRGWRMHLDRFARSARAAASELGAELDIEASADSADGLDAFLLQARDRIAEYGEGFPRLELLLCEPRGSAPADDRPVEERPELRLSLRPLPELRETLELRSVRTEPLPHPERKGPGIDRLGALNRELGAEALLTDAEGLAVEGATTSLLWWEGRTLCSVRTTARVASVTERILLGIAERLGTPTARSRAEPVALAGREVWAVNALHGLRTVTRIDGVLAPPPDPERLRGFSEALDRSWEPLATIR